MFEIFLTPILRET